MTSEYVTTSADEITKTGTNRIKINYGGQSFNLDVKGVGVNSIEITTPPTKIDYIVGEELDVTGGKVTVTYSDNTTAELDLTLDLSLIHI